MGKLGSVRVQLRVDEYLWHPVNLFNLESIQGLLHFGNEFKNMIIYQGKSANYLKENNQEIIVLYADLDNLIKQCNFSKRQQQILFYYYVKGYNEQEIAEFLGDDEKNIKGTIKSICKKLLTQEKINYRMGYLYWDKVKVPAELKICNQCGKELLATEEYFSPDNRNKDGLRGICKVCDNYTKNMHD